MADISGSRRRQRLAVAVVGLTAGLIAGCQQGSEPTSVGITSPTLPTATAPATEPTVATTEPGVDPPPPPSTGASSTTTAATAACVSYREVSELPISLCDKGDLVRTVQAEIARELSLELESDGFFGPATEDAVRRFQQRERLNIDGIVGPLTWNALFGSDLEVNGSSSGIATNWYQQPAVDAAAALEDQGFIVIDYEVCSNSVAAGLVRQIIGGDGTVYLDRDGVTEAGKELPVGEVIEVKISSGAPCS